MQLILVLPGLSELRAAVTASVRAPALARLLAMAGAPAREGGGAAAALAARYGVVRQTDWPLAPIRLAALGIDPGAAYWLAADPVTLEAGRSDVRLAGAVEDLSRADADALTATLNAHFADDGLAFVAARPDAFFVRAATSPRLATHPLAATGGRPLHRLLPEGEDADAWRRWQSEIEMLLHEHPVNRERERAGLPIANSVWFSCGGTLPPRPGPAAPVRTFADAGVALALAAHVGSPADALPRDLGAARADARGAQSIVVVQGGAQSTVTAQGGAESTVTAQGGAESTVTAQGGAGSTVTAQGGAESTVTAQGGAGSTVAAREGALDIERLERCWAAPARDALEAGAFDAVTLLTEEAGDALVWRARRPGPWQRLAGRRRRHDLAALLGRASRDG